MLGEGMRQLGKQSMRRHATRMEQGLDQRKGSHTVFGYYQGATQRWPMHGSFFGVVSEGFEVHQLFGPAIFDILPLVVSILTLQRMKAILLTLVLSTILSKNSCKQISLTRTLYINSCGTS
jgi:hypothetical protein